MGANDEELELETGAGSAERVTFQLGDWEPPTQYNQPHLEPDGTTRTVEHKVLSDSPVIQKIGENAERFTLRGNCYEHQIRILRQMRGKQKRIRHPVYSGEVFIETTNFQSTSSYDQVLDQELWVYIYTMELIEVK